MNLSSFAALIASDLRQFLASRRFFAILFATALVHVLWVLFLSFISPLALSEASAVCSPSPVCRLLAVPSFTLMTWRDELRNGSLCLVFSSLLSSRALALGRFVALLITTLILCVVPLVSVASLSLLLPYPPLAFAPLLIALLWLAVVVCLVSTFIALLFPKSPFVMLVPILLSLLAALAEWIWPALDVLFPFRHWRDFMGGLITLEALALLLSSALVLLWLEGRLLESLRRGGNC